MKLSLIAADMRIYLENQKGSIPNKLSKVVGNNCISIYQQQTTGTLIFLNAIYHTIKKVIHSDNCNKNV